MTSKATTPEQYIEELPEDRKDAIRKLRQVILENIPEGFQETMSYGMVGYVVPHEIYPAGYYCTPNLPLPFINFASQKSSINFYHIGLYANAEIMQWFISEYPKHSKQKLDMGKSCIRFKKIDQIPFDLLGELVAKISVADWISLYEEKIKK